MSNSSNTPPSDPSGATYQIKPLTDEDIQRQYVDLDRIVNPSALIVATDSRVLLFKDVDYYCSVANGVTRVHFSGPSALNGVSELLSGESLIFVYSGGLPFFSNQTQPIDPSPEPTTNKKKIDLTGPDDAPVYTDATDLNQGEGDPGFHRVGPLLDVERFQQEYLFGIPMRAALTGETITEETLKRFIEKAISDFETSVRIPVRPVRVFQKFDYERADDLAFGCRQLKRWPLLKVESLKALWPGRVEGQEANYPTNWIEADGDTGLIRIVPRSGTDVQTNINFVSASGYIGLPLAGNFKTWPGMWRVTYIAGFAQDRVPEAVNDLIGILAAIKFLSQMGPAIFPYNSQSIGIDGLSQGTGSGGPQWLAGRLQDLEMQRDRLTQQLKAHYGTDIILMAF